MWNAIEYDGTSFGKSKGVEYIELSSEETERWARAVEPVIGQYVQRMVSRGYKEDEVRGWIKYLEERRDYLAQQQKALQIRSATGSKEFR